MPRFTDGGSNRGSGGGGGGFNKTGREKLAGETAPVALTPLQPLQSNRTTGIAANRRTFQLNLTQAEYKRNHVWCNHYFQLSFGVALAKKGVWLDDHAGATSPNTSWGTKVPAKPCFA